MLAPLRPVNRPPSDRSQANPQRPDARSRARKERDEQASLFEELAAIYREVDHAFAGHGCPASTECCRFGITGREPYVTSIELALVERAVARLGGARAIGKPPAPLTAPEEPSGRGKRRLAVVDERVCPLLDASGRCSIYAARPLGCRTFWCDRASGAGEVARREVNAFVRRIQDLAARHKPGGDQGRPLTRAIAPRR
jgi:Fe-S-cluster containining protein